MHLLQSHSTSSRDKTKLHNPIKTISQSDGNLGSLLRNMSQTASKDRRTLEASFIKRSIYTTARDKRTSFQNKGDHNRLSGRE